MKKTIKGNKALVAAALSALASQAANGVQIPIEKRLVDLDQREFALDALKADNYLVQEAGVFSSNLVLDDEPITKEQVIIAYGTTTWQSATDGGEGAYDVYDSSAGSISPGQDSDLYHLDNATSRTGSGYDLELLDPTAETCHTACHVNCHGSRSWR